MKIEKNKVVSITYTLREGNAEGPVVEQVPTAEPFTFLYGAGSLLPLFEENLSNLEKGGGFQFQITSDEGYGERNEDAVVDLAKSVFEIDGKVAEELMQPGAIVPMRDEQGNPLNGTVIEVVEETVKVDFNHPMAGIDLHFTGEVIEVREATAEELDHGHAHGPGGHRH